jgi:hypothetical protein
MSVEALTWETAKEEIARVHVALEHIGNPHGWRAIQCRPTEPVPQAMYDSGAFPAHCGVVVLANDVPHSVRSSFASAEMRGLLKAKYAILVLRRGGWELEPEMDWQI